jgi:putative dimethyl sulfoxide reductase chaperone
MQKTNLLTKIEVARARSLAYNLFARLFLKGPSPSTVETIAAVPELEQALGKEQSLAEITFEKAASDHFHLFHFNIFPYQSMFLDPEGNLGGKQSEQVLAYYRQAGFELSPQSPAASLAAGESPDHIGLELAFMSYLSHIEAAAMPDDEQHLSDVRSRQRGFFDLHLLLWLPVLVQAISLQGSPFYKTLAELTQELAFEHYASLIGGTPVRQKAFDLPHPPAVLEDEKNGLGDIAAYLLIPAYSGLYLSREDIARLGRRRSLPRGFGSRQQMLTNLLRSSVEYDQLPALMGDLQALLDEWHAGYRSHHEEQTPWRHYAGAWLERLQATQTILNRISTEASKGEGTIWVG